MRYFFIKRNILSSIVSIVLSVAFVASVTFASSTISTNISTGGTLSVTGASTFTGVGTFNGQLQASSTALFGGNVTTYAGVTIGSATVINSLDGTILFKAQTSDPTGVTQGTIYYNSTDKVLKLFDGTNWFTTGTTTSGISLSGARLQLANLATQYLTIGTSSQNSSGNAVATFAATTTASVPLVLSGILSQTGHLFDIRDDANANLIYVTSAGALFASSTVQATGALTAYGAVTLGDNAVDAITITGNATTTNSLSVGGNFFVGGHSTTTGSTGAFITLGNATTSAFYAGGGLTVNGLATTSSTGNLGVMGKIGAGTTTPTTLELSAEGAGTTTIAAYASTAAKGGCIQLEGTNDVMYRTYVGAGGLATTTPSGAAGFLAVWEVGSCK